jgi:hypothetical protein
MKETLLNFLVYFASCNDVIDMFKERIEFCIKLVVAQPNGNFSETEICDDVDERHRHYFADCHESWIFWIFAYNHNTKEAAESCQPVMTEGI